MADESGEPGNPIILTASAEDRGSPYINGSGQAEFQLAHNGRVASVTSDSKVNDGGYYHVLAEADRESGRLTISKGIGLVLRRGASPCAYFKFNFTVLTPRLSQSKQT